MSFDDLLGFFLTEDFLKVLGFAGVVTGDEMDPLAMCNISGGVGEVEGGKVGWALFTFSGVERSWKASSMDEGMEEAILGLSWRTDSASATLDFKES